MDAGLYPGFETLVTSNGYTAMFALFRSRQAVSYKGNMSAVMNPMREGSSTENGIPPVAQITDLRPGTPVKALASCRIACSVTRIA